MVEGVFADPSTLATMTTAEHRPLALIEHAQAVLHEALGPGGTDVKHESPLEAVVFQRLLDSIQGLGVPLVRLRVSQPLAQPQPEPQS